MQVQFSKMQGLGNDFMVVDNVTQNVFFSPEKIQQLSNRHFGIGFDQMLLVEPPYDPEQDFHYRIFNADGSEVSQCGNGARCFARFVKQRGLINKNRILVGTKSGKMVLHIEKDGQVTVNMGRPQLSPDSIPLKANKQEITYILRCQNETVFYGAVSMGNPHCVVTVDSVDDAAVDSLGSELSNHERFPEKANVGFMQVISSEYIKLRVYERGVGETLACGSGACAAVVIGQLQGVLSENVTVELPGGKLLVRWNGSGHTVKMSGPAEHVFDGQLFL